MCLIGGLERLAGLLAARFACIELGLQALQLLLDVGALALDALLFLGSLLLGGGGKRVRAVVHRGEPQCAGKAGGAEEFQTGGLHGAKYGVDRLGKNKSKTKGKFALSMSSIIAAKEPDECASRLQSLDSPLLRRHSSECGDQGASDP